MLQNEDKIVETVSAIVTGMADETIDIAIARISTCATIADAIRVLHGMKAEARKDIADVVRAMMGDG